MAHLRRLAGLRDTSLTDGQLLERYIAQQDEAAFELLLIRHGPMVLGVCRRILGQQADAEDAFQATFLVLVRKAETVRPREQVGSWLYGVAYNTALKARAAAAKRKAREREVGAMPRPEAPAVLGEQVQALLDQELRALPDFYRTPIVLCDLEGKTRKEAAEQLGWKEGTVASRLARGRALLGQRLARHGITLAAALASLAAGTASAAVPVTLAATTLEAAAVYAAGGALAVGVIPANVLTLTDGVLKAMLLTKLKIATAVLVLIGTLTAGVGGWAYGIGAGGGVGPGTSSGGSVAAGQPDAKPRGEAQPDRGKGPRDAVDELIRRRNEDLQREITAEIDILIQKVYRAADEKTEAEALADLERAVSNLRAAIEKRRAAAAADRIDATRRRERLVAELAQVRAAIDQVMKQLRETPDDPKAAELLADLEQRLQQLRTGLENERKQAAKAPEVPEAPPASGWRAVREMKLLGRPGMFAFSPDGKALATAVDRSVLIWDAATGRELRSAEGHTAAITSLAVSPDGSIIASTGGDRTLRLWDTATGKEIKRLPDSTAGIEAVAFSPDGKRLASAGHGTVKLWDTTSGTEIFAQTGKQPAVSVIAFGPTGRELAFTSGQTVTVWDIAQQRNIRVMEAGEQEALQALAFSPDGKRLAVGFRTPDPVAKDGGKVALWDLVTGQVQIDLQAEAVRSVTFSPDGKLLVAGSDKGSVRIWDTVTGKQLAPLPYKGIRVWMVRFAPDGRTLVVLEHDSVLMFFVPVSKAKPEP
jgi:RNA polymerase sigma factor (sigma-70 family)